MSSFSFLVLCLLCNGVRGVDRTLQPFYSESDNPCNKTKTVNLLVMAPFPDSTGLDPGEDTGPIVIPASVLAANSINERCDMLGDYRIQLVVADSGCNIITRAISGLVDITFDPQYQVVGIIGPRCSVTAIEIGAFLAHPNIDLLHISPSATSPKLLNRTKFPNTFRTLSSSHGFIAMYLALIRDMEVKNVAILFEHVNPVQAAAANSFQSQLQNFDEVTVTVFGMSSSFIPLEQIENRFRLVFVFGGEDIARRFLCLALHRNMVHPDYQFFFSEILLADLRGVAVVSVSVNGVTLICTGGTGNMTNATLGIMLSLPVLVRRDTETPLVDNATTAKFYEPYFSALFEYLKQIGLARLGRFVQEIDNHQTGYYDSVWAFALALNASMPRLESELGVSLDNYAYGHPNITKIIRSELLKVRFEGTRGTVHFNEETFDGENVTHLQILNILDSLNQRQIVAEFDPTLPEEKRIQILNGTAFIPDSFDQVIIAPPIYAEVVVLLIVALVAITLIVFHVINVKWTGVQSIKVTSPFLNNLIFSGCYIYLISILFLSFERTTGDKNPIAFAVKCSGFIWCETIAFSLIFGTICVKTWRILRIFSASSAKVIGHLDNHFLVLYVSLVVAVDIFFNILWNVIDPWVMKKRRIDEQRIGLSCDCRNLSVWVSVLLSQKVVLTIVVLYLSIATRQVRKKEYKQTKSTNVLVYIYVLLNSLLVPLFLLLLNSESIILVTVSYLSICLKNILCVVMCILLVFLPPMLPLLKRKWNALLKRPLY